MSLIELFLINLAAAASVMILAWLVHLLLGKASIVDFFWGPGFAVMAWLTFSLTQADLVHKLLIAVLVSIWAFRLAFHIARRNLGKPEDPRYADMRAKHPDNFWIRSLFTVFLLQAAVMWLVSLPVQLGQQGPSSGGLGLLDWIGLLIWSVGFFWETIGDEQLYRFKSDPANKGKVLDSGLWRYSRHPNYFGEAIMWWALFLIAFSAPNGGWSFIGPLLLTLLLLKVSGVSLTEQKMSQTYSELEKYKGRVSAFIPRPPKEPKP